MKRIIAVLAILTLFVLPNNARSTLITTADQTSGSTFQYTDMNQILNALKNGTLEINTAGIRLGGTALSANAVSLISAADFAAMLPLLSIDDAFTALGISVGATTLGTFTGSTIPDSSSTKAALQSLETALEALGSPNFTHIWNTLGVAADSDNLGAFTGTTIADSSDIKEALQTLETAIEAIEAAGVTIDDTPVNGVIDHPISSNWAYDHVADADPHPGYVLESLYDAYSVLYADTDNTPAALSMAAGRFVGRGSTGGIAALIPSSNLSISGTTVDTVQGIQTTSTPRFARLGLGMAADAAAALVSSGFTVDADGDVTLKSATSPATASGPGLGLWYEDSDNGSSYVGIGSAASNNNSLILLLPTANPTAGQVITWGVPSSVTFADGVARNASVGTFADNGSGSMVYPDAGIAVSTSAAWGASLTAPSGTIVGTTDTQTLTNKTLTIPVVNNAATSGGYVELREDTDNGTNYARIKAADAITTDTVLTLPEIAADTLVGVAAAQTLTNKTLDAEGTGNSITIPVSFWIQAAGCNNATATSFLDLPTANAAAPACITGTNTQKGVLDFDAATDESAQVAFQLPSDAAQLTSGNGVDINIKWLAAATSGSVVWGVQTSCVADGETDDPSWNTASTVTDAVKGTTLQTNDAAIADVTATGCAAGEYMHLRVYRDADNGSDDMTGDARLIGVNVTYRRAM